MAGPALVPVRGGKVHALRTRPDRPLPEIGNLTVWQTECGRIAFGRIKDWREVEAADHCKRCGS